MPYIVYAGDRSCVVLSRKQCYTGRSHGMVIYHGPDFTLAGQLLFCRVRWPSILFCILVILTAEGFQEDPVSVLSIPCILIIAIV